MATARSPAKNLTHARLAHPVPRADQVARADQAHHRLRNQALHQHLLRNEQVGLETRLRARRGSNAVTVVTALSLLSEPSSTAIE